MTHADKIAIAAHMNILLRRHLGRMTDVEYMAKNPDYARELIHLAQSSPHEDLHTWAAKLQAVHAANPTGTDDASRATSSGHAQRASTIPTDPGLATWDRANEPVARPRAQYVSTLR